MAAKASISSEKLSGNGVMAAAAIGGMKMTAALRKAWPASTLKSKQPSRHLGHQ